MKSVFTIKVLGALAGVFMGLVVTVEMLGYAAWALTPKDSASIEQAAGFERQMGGHIGAQKFGAFQASDETVIPSHRVTEWPLSNGRNFSQAPMLHALVSQGKLPPGATRCRTVAGKSIGYRSAGAKLTIRRNVDTFW